MVEPPPASELRTSLDRLGRGLLSVGSAVAPVVGGVAASVGSAVAESAERLIDETAQRLPRYSAAFLREQMANKRRLLTELSETCFQLGLVEEDHRSDRDAIALLEQRVAAAVSELEELRGRLELSEQSLRSSRLETERLRTALSRVLVELGQDEEDSLAGVEHAVDVIRSVRSLVERRGGRSLAEDLSAQLRDLRGLQELTGQELVREVMLGLLEKAGEETAGSTGPGDLLALVGLVRRRVESMAEERGVLRDAQRRAEVEEAARREAEAVLKRREEALLAALGREEQLRRSLEHRVHEMELMRSNAEARFDSVLRELEHMKVDQAVQSVKSEESSLLLDRLEQQMLDLAEARSEVSEQRRRVKESEGVVQDIQCQMDEKERSLVKALERESCLQEELRISLISKRTEEEAKIELSQRVAALETDYTELMLAMEQALVVEQQKDNLLQKLKSELETALISTQSLKACEKDLRASLAAAIESRDDALSKLESSRSELEGSLTEIRVFVAREIEIQQLFSAAIISSSTCSSTDILSLVSAFLLENKSIHAQLDQSKIRINQLTSLREKLEEELRDREFRRNEDIDAIKELQSSLHQLEIDHEREVNELKGDVGRLERSLNSMEIRNKDLGAELARLVEKNVETCSLMEREINDRDNKLLELEAEVTILRDKFIALQDAHAVLEQENYLLQTDKRDLGLTVARIVATVTMQYNDEEITRLVQSNDIITTAAVEDLITVLERKLGMFQESNMTLIESAKPDLEELQTRLNEAQSFLSIATQQRQRSDADCFRLRKAFRESQQRVQDAVQENFRLKEEIRMCRQELLERKAELSHLEDQCSASKNEAIVALETLGRERECATQLRNELLASEDVVIQIKSEYAALLTINSTLTAELARSRSDIEEISGRLVIAVSALNDERSLCSSLRITGESQLMLQSDLEERLRQMQMKIEDHEIKQKLAEDSFFEELNSLRTTNSELASELCDATRALQVLKDSYEQLMEVAKEADTDNEELKRALCKAEEEITDRDCLLRESEKRLAEWGVITDGLKQEMAIVCESSRCREKELHDSWNENELLRAEWMALKGELEIAVERLNEVAQAKNRIQLDTDGFNSNILGKLEQEKLSLEKLCTEKQAELDRRESALASISSLLSGLLDMDDVQIDARSGRFDVLVPKIEGALQKLIAFPKAESAAVNLNKEPELLEKLEISALKTSKLELEYAAILSERNEMECRIQDLLLALKAQNDALATVEEVEASILSEKKQLERYCAEAEAKAIDAIEKRIAFEQETVVKVQELRDEIISLEDEVTSLRSVISEHRVGAASGYAAYVSFSEEGDRVDRFTSWVEDIISVSLDSHEALTVAFAQDIHIHNDLMAVAAGLKTAVVEKLSKGLRAKLRCLRKVSDIMHHLHDKLLTSPWGHVTVRFKPVIAAHESFALKDLRITTYDEKQNRYVKSPLISLMSES